MTQAPPETGVIPDTNMHDVIRNEAKFHAFESVVSALDQPKLSLQECSEIAMHLSNLVFDSVDDPVIRDRFKAIMVEKLETVLLPCRT